MFLTRSWSLALETISEMLSICLSVGVSIRQSICLPACLPVVLSVCLSDCLPAFLHVCLSLCLSVCFVCLSTWFSFCCPLACLTSIKPSWSPENIAPKLQDVQATKSRYFPALGFIFSAIEKRKQSRVNRHPLICKITSHRGRSAVYR